MFIAFKLKTNTQTLLCIEFLMIFNTLMFGKLAFQGKIIESAIISLVTQVIRLRHT